MTTEGTNGGVRINNREIYDMLLEVKDSLKDARSELKADVAKIQSELEGENEDIIELQTRVRSLELKFYGILAGLVGAVVVLLKAGDIGL